MELIFDRQTTILSNLEILQLRMEKLEKLQLNLSEDKSIFDNPLNKLKVRQERILNELKDLEQRTKSISKDKASTNQESQDRTDEDYSQLSPIGLRVIELAKEMGLKR